MGFAAKHCLETGKSSNLEMSTKTRLRASRNPDLAFIMGVKCTLNDVSRSIQDVLPNMDLTTKTSFITALHIPSKAGKKETARVGEADTRSIINSP